MKTSITFLGLFFFSMVSLADTPAPGTVKARMYSGDGNTAIGVTGTALNVNVTNSSGLSTVNQGLAGFDSWLTSITSSVLPTNACQETGGHLASIDSKLSSALPVTGTFWQVTQPVSLAALPALPTGSNTIGAVNINGTVPVSGTVTANAGSGTFSVDASGHTVPVSGSFWQATQPVSVASLPLPSGAATEASLTTVKNNTGSSSTSLSSIDAKVPALGQALAAASTPVVLTAAQVSTLTPLSTITANAGTGTFNVNASGFTVPVSGTFWQATQPVSGTVTANAGSGTFNVDASGHTVPVSGTFWQATQPVSGTVTANLGTIAGIALDSSVTGLQVAQSSTTSGQSGGLALGAVTTAAPSYTTAKSNPLSLTTAGALRTDGSAVTQPVSAASLPLPSGAATAAKQPALGTAGSASADVISVQGVASMTALKVDGSAVTQPVSGTFWQATQPVSGTFYQATQPVSGTFWQATQPVSVATLPALAAGSAVIGKVSIDQTTPGTTNLVALAGNQSVNAAQINGVTPLMGNGVTGTGSQRVTIASDNTAFSVNAIPKTAAAVTVKQAAITVGTSAVRLTNDGLVPPSTRVLLVAQLLSSSTAGCFFGSSNVTTTSTTRGVQMFAGQTLSFNRDAGDYYAICDASSQTILVTEQE